MNRNPLLRILALIVAFLPGLLLPALAESRVALVMGVGEYDGNFGLKRLPGIASDLQRMRQSLESVGFTVTVVSDPTLVEAEEAIEEFGECVAQNKGVALFYFSGHGGEFEGKNYLIPRGARIVKARDVKEQAVAAQRVLGRMEEAKNKTNIVFLDCCRNDLAKAATDSGMAAMNARGTFIGFATASEKVAQASTEGSPYTISLAKHIPLHGLSITDMHTKVTKEVEQMTGGEDEEGQTPFQYSGLSDVFYFVPSDGYVPPPVASTRPSAPDTSKPPAERPQPADDSGLGAFIAKWWDHQGSDEASVWASDFTSPCDYCYADSGTASRTFITEDRRKLINRYSRRLYTLLEDPKVTLNGDTAFLSVKFEYRYNGKKTTQGRAQLDLGLVKLNGDWKISSYDEKVLKGAIRDGDESMPSAPAIPSSSGDSAGARAAISAFVENWWDHQTSDSAAVWAADFRNSCDYCYGEGKSSRSFIQKDRQKLLNSYTRRTIRPVIQPEVNLTGNGTTATVRMIYEYEYSGTRSASGTATVNMNLSWDGSTWGITRYSEKTRRN